jgi:hypothetical protein
MKAFPAVLRICVVAVGVFVQANATVGGTASDATGALVPGVRITGLNVNTGISLNVVANQSGNYPFASLQPDLFKRNIMDLAANRPTAIATGANNANATLAGTHRSQGRRR